MWKDCTQKVAIVPSGQEIFQKKNRRAMIISQSGRFGVEDTECLPLASLLLPVIVLNTTVS